jgi:hypothetical protein
VISTKGTGWVLVDEDTFYVVQQVLSHHGEQQAYPTTQVSSAIDSSFGE